MRKCPYCAEVIQDEAVVCRFCGRSVVDQAPLRDKLVKERRAFLVGSLIILVSAWGLGYYFKATAVIDPRYPILYDSLIFALRLVTLAAHIAFLVLALRLSVILGQSWWVTLLMGILVFGLSMIVFVTLWLAANGKIARLTKQPMPKSVPSS